MILYNPKPNKRKSGLVIATIVLVNALITAGVVVAILVLCGVISSNYTKQVWVAWVALGGIVVGIFLYWLLNKLLLGVYDRYRVSVNIKGYGIALCECGNYYKPSDIQCQVDGNSVSTRIEEQGSSTTTTTKGNILIQCTCPKCGKVHNDSIIGVQLAQSYDSIKRVWLTTNIQPTYKHKSTSEYTSEDELGKKVREKYEHDMLYAERRLRHYESLGYTTKNIKRKDCIQKNAVSRKS